MIIFDCEIKKMIQGRNERRLEGFDYCDGWGDYKGMGISVVCLYDLNTSTNYIIVEPDTDPVAREQLQSLLSHAPYVVGFNNHGFDNKLLDAHGIKVSDAKSYDIYEQVIKAAGLANAPFYERKGYKLDDIARANSLPRKTGEGGAQAPVMYQRGDLQRLHAYCMNDVKMTAEVMKLIMRNKLLCPRSSTVLPVDVPSFVLTGKQASLF